MSVSQASHLVKISADLVEVRIVGSLRLSDSQYIYHHCDRMLAERGYVLALFDLSSAALPTPESRQWISHWFKNQDVNRMAVATFGTTLLVRTVNRMFDSAVSLLSGSPAPTRHFSNGTEARAWLAERRSVVGAGTKA
jgi:hypothetical protein